MEEQAAAPLRDRDFAQHEYTELSLTFRHYSTLRFAVLTVFFAVVGALASVAFGVTKPGSPAIAQYAKVAGLIVSLAFFLLEVLIEKYLRYFVSLALELERELGYKVFSGRPQSKFLQTRFATWGLFLLIILSWLFALAFT